MSFGDIGSIINDNKTKEQQDKL